MTQLTTFDDLFKNAFGFRNVFDELDRTTRQNSAGFPPYNIITNSTKEPSQYVVEMAVAGYDRDELSVAIHEERGVRTLIIKGEKRETVEDESEVYVVKMLAARNFTRSFTIAKEAEVDAVELKNGILRVVVKVDNAHLRPAVKQLTIS
jgi:HSP20 family molecular chaperone IbpA